MLSETSVWAELALFHLSTPYRTFSYANEPFVAVVPVFFDINGGNVIFSILTNVIGGGADITENQRPDT